MGKLIGIFATEISSRVQGSLYKLLHAQAQTCGYNLVFFSANVERLKDATDEKSLDLFDMADNMPLSAMLIHAQSINNKEYVEYLIDMGKRKDIPIFVYDCSNMGITADEGVITINLNYKQGFADGVKHILEHHNCKNVYMLAGIKGNQFSEERIDAYKQEMTAHGFEVKEDNILYGDFWEVPAQAAVNNLLDSNLPKPDAICCANDSMAIAAARCLQTRGYRVPEDVKIVGFDGIEDGKYNFPVIATCQPVLDVVPDFIFDAIKNGMRTGELFVPLKFYPKESCGCENIDATSDRIELARLLDSSRQNAWQHSMLSNMQLQLMDSCNPDEIAGYMNGIIGLFEGYKHLYCIRDDIEMMEDDAGSFDKVRIQLNMDFLPEKDYGVFSSKEIIPEFEQTFLNAASDEIFIIYIINTVVKEYGYSIIRANYYSTTQIKIFAQFSESFTNMLENTLRNRRLEKVNQKLSEMYERMSEIYIRDMMTGLYNRTGYYNELSEYMQREDMQEKYIHVINVDMDGMKMINDNFGHQEGDVAIKAVAKAINDCFAHPCISARFGGDEFMVSLISDTMELPQQTQISDRLNNYLDSMPALLNKEYKVGVSVGHAVSKMSDLKDIKVLEKIADDSMYNDKRRRKGMD